MVLLAIVFSFSFFALWNFRNRVTAQQPCTTPPPYQTGNTSTKWAPNAVVAVVFDENANFSQAEKDAIGTASQNWNNSNGILGNNSGVTLSGFTSGPPPPIDTTTPVMFITRGNAGSNQSVVGVRANGNTWPYTSQATVTISDAINWSFPPDLTSVMAHETHWTLLRN